MLRRFQILGLLLTLLIVPAAWPQAGTTVPTTEYAPAPPTLTYRPWNWIDP